MYHLSIAHQEIMGIEWWQNSRPSSQVTIMGNLWAVAWKDILQPSETKLLAI